MRRASIPDQALVALRLVCRHRSALLPRTVPLPAVPDPPLFWYVPSKKNRRLMGGGVEGHSFDTCGDLFNRYLVCPTETARPAVCQRGRPLFLQVVPNHRDDPIGSHRDQSLLV